VRLAGPRPVATLLVVGAHALDAELMAGALAASAARRGHRVTLLHLTRGERGHPHRPPEEFARQLDEEMAEAAHALGVRHEWAGFPAPLPDVEDVVPAVAGVVDRLAPDVVVTHWSGSWHPSHVRAHRAVLRAVQTVDHSPSILYGENCEDLTGFRPVCFVPIEDVYGAWLRGLRSYELFRLSEPGAEASPIPYWSYYTAAARVRGLQAGFDLAQAFMPGSRRLPPGLGLRCPEWQPPPGPSGAEGPGPSGPTLVSG
jgi:LmbE family N-acetylglucosaminyl deacetylase